MVTLLISLIIICVAGALIIFRLAQPPAHYKGPKSDHFDGKRFHNIKSENRSFIEFIQWLVTRQPKPWPNERALKQEASPPLRVLSDVWQVTYVNHSTMLLQIGGLNILTDPIWSERCSPFKTHGPKRVHPPGVPFDNLPPIDIVLVSHNHYDHMDLQTLQKLLLRDQPLLITGLGNASTLSQMGWKKVTELDWWKSTDLRSDTTVTFVPAQHFSSRAFYDRNVALWGGFVIKQGGELIYFAGDTGYGEVFKQIKSRLGKPQLSFLPIGGYAPRWFMKPVHMSPEEAVQAHCDLESKLSVAMHFGTFPLSDEGIDDPPEALQEALQKQNIQDGRFIILEPGETRVIRGNK